MPRLNLNSLRFFILLIIGIMIFGCTRIDKVTVFPGKKEELFAVIPFENYTITPLAGYRVATILEGVLRSKGYNLLNRVWNYKDEEPTAKDFDFWIKRAEKKGANIIILGSVNEFRYKTGIDGEPAVSITIYFYDVRRKKIIWSATVSSSGFSFSSLGVLCQELLEKVFD